MASELGNLQVYWACSAGGGDRKGSVEAETWQMGRRTRPHQRALILLTEYTLRLHP